MEVFLLNFLVETKAEKKRESSDVFRLSFFRERKPKSVEDIDVPRFCKGRVHNSAHPTPLFICSLASKESRNAQDDDVDRNLQMYCSNSC